MSLVKIPSTASLGRLAGIELCDGVEATISSLWKLWVHLKRPDAIKLNGKDSGEPVAIDSLTANGVFEFNFGICAPTKSAVHMTVNPEFAARCIVSHSTLFLQETRGALVVVASTFKAVDLSDLDWLVALAVENQVRN